MGSRKVNKGLKDSGLITSMAKEAHRKMGLPFGSDIKNDFLQFSLTSYSCHSNSSCLHVDTSSSPGINAQAAFASNG